MEITFLHSGVAATQVNANISHFSLAIKREEIVKCIQNVRRMQNLFEYLYKYTHTKMACL